MNQMGFVCTLHLDGRIRCQAAAFDVIISMLDRADEKFVRVLEVRIAGCNNNKTNFIKTVGVSTLQLQLTITFELEIVLAKVAEGTA